MSHDRFARVMVLAAGRGERMRPLTSVLPKPALPMPDGPVVASALRLAATVGSVRVVVNTCHLGRRMAEALAEIQIEGVEIAISHEDELMGTAGGIALARDRGLLGHSGSVLVINGDCTVGLQLNDFAAVHRARHDLVTMALLPHLDPERWSRVVLESDGSVSAIRPPGSPALHEVPFLYPGVMALHRDAIDDLPSTPGEIPESLWYPAMSTGKLGGAVVAGRWHEVGNPADYLEATLGRLAGSSVIDRSARVAAGAVVENSFVGRDAAVADGAKIQHSIVAEGAVVGANAAVERSVLLGSIEISAGKRITSENLAGQRCNV
jgi:mannose-1-phosphate guanylyltransferase